MVYINQDTRLEAVDEDTITSLLANEVDEDIYFDFKEGMDSTSDDDKHNIRKALVSFANTGGGFLFFGILDKNNKQGKRGVDRAVGVGRTDELGRRITQKYLDRGLCLPLIVFEGPRIVQVWGNNVAVVKVPRSERRPHAVKKTQDGVLEFWARGSGTVRPMDYDYLVTELDQSREARGWLNALYIDLKGVLTTAQYNQRSVSASAPLQHDHHRRRRQLAEGAKRRR